jgi:hypothetical protein
MRFGIHPAMHNGACSLCGAMVPSNSFECPKCGAAWYSWQGPIMKALRIFFSIPAVLFSVAGGALLALSLINQAPLSTVEYFTLWIIIGILCKVVAKILPNTHSGWFQT